MVMTPDGSPSNMFDSSMTASNGDDTRRISVKYVWQLNDSVKWWWHPTDLRQICLTAQWQRQMMMTPDWSPSSMFVNDSVKSMTASNAWWWHPTDLRQICLTAQWQRQMVMTPDWSPSNMFDSSMTASNDVMTPDGSPPNMFLTAQWQRQMVMTPDWSPSSMFDTQCLTTTDLRLRQMVMTPDGSPSNMFDSSMTASNGDDTRLISVKYVWQLNDSVKWWWHPTDLRRICLTAQWQRQMVMTPDGSPSICLTAQWQRQMVMTPDGSPSNMFDSSMTASNDDDTRLISVKYVWQLNDSVKWWWHPTDLRQICSILISVKYVWQLNDSVKWWWPDAQWQRQNVWQLVMTPDGSPSIMFDSSMTASNLMTPDGSPSNMFDSSMTASNGDDTRRISVKYVWQLNDSVKWWWHPTDLRQICLTAQWQRQMVMTPDGSPSNIWQLNDSSMTASNEWWHPTDLRQICLTAQWQRQMVMTPDWSPSNMFDSSMTASNGDDTRLRSPSMTASNGDMFDSSMTASMTRRISVKYVDSSMTASNADDTRLRSPSNMFDSSMTASNGDDTRLISVKYVWQLNDSVKWWWHPTDLRQVCLTAQWQRQMVMNLRHMFDSSMTASNDDDTRRISAQICLTAQTASNDNTRRISVKYVWQLNVKLWWHPTDLRQICLTAQWQRQMVMTPDWSPSNMFDSSMTASSSMTTLNGDDTRRISVNYVRQLNDSVKWWWHPTDLRQICLTAQWQRQMMMTPDDLRQVCLTAQWQRQMVMTPDWSPSNMFDSSNDSVKWWWHPTDLRRICLTAQWQRLMVITPDGSPSNMFDSSMSASNDDDTRLISVKYVWQLKWQRQMMMTPDGSPPNMFDSSMTASNGDNTRRISVKYVRQLNVSVKWWWHPTDLRQVCLTAQWQRQMVITPDGSPSNMFDSSMTASNGDDTRRISVKYVWQLNDSVKWWWHPTDLSQICSTAQWQRQMMMTPDWSPSNMFDSSMTASNGDNNRLISVKYVWQLNDSVKLWWHPTDLRQICLTAQWQRQMLMTPDGSPPNMFDSSMTAWNGDDTRLISVKYVWQLNDSVKWWLHPTDLRRICLTAQWQRQMVMTPDWYPSSMFDSSMTASNGDETRLISVKYVWQLNDSVKWW